MMRASTWRFLGIFMCKFRRGKSIRRGEWISLSRDEELFSGPLALSASGAGSSAGKDNDRAGGEERSNRCSFFFYSNASAGHETRHRDE